MIYYLSPDNTTPSGGVKTLYRHVDLHNAAGRPARILHTQNGFKCTWFGNDTAIVYTDRTPLYPGEDVLVLPEIHGPHTATIAPGVRKVIFNQNSHYTFRSYPIPPHATCPTPYTSPEVVGTMVLTDYCRDTLEWAFPAHPFAVVPHGINPVTFPLSDVKRQQIAYMPRKHADEAQQVFGWLRYRGALDGWDVVAIDGLTEDETSRVMQESLVYFAFGYPEGGTLPPFEAMATGCVVVGYGGHSSDTHLDQCGGWLIASSDSNGFAKDADRILRWPVEKLVEWGRDSARLVRETFSLTHEADALTSAWTRFGL